MWEMIKKQLIGKACSYGPDWTTHACIVINKTGITLNQLFMESYGIKGSLCVLHDAKNRKIGFKVPVSEADQDAAFKVQSNNTNNSKYKAGFITAARVVKQYVDTDVAGKAIRARLSPGEGIIEVQLPDLNGVGA